MQINITNGTLTSIQETLSPASGYSLPSTITVTGATSDYNGSSGSITLTALTNAMSITATGKTAETNIFSIGNLPIDNIYFGDLPVMKVYLGDILIYEAKPIVEDSNFLLNNGDYLYCSNGAIFDTRVISVETSAGEVVTTWSGEDVQVYDE